jgi:hypothetical protein
MARLRGRTRYVALSIVAVLSLGGTQAAAQAPTYVWGRVLAGPGRQTVNAIAVDSNDDVVVTGDIEGNVDFTGDGLADVSVDTPSLYVAKFGGDGRLLWVHTVRAAISGGTGVTVAPGVDRSVYVSGYFQGTAEFLSSDRPPVTCVCPYDGAYAGLLLAYNMAGVLQWTRAFDGTAQDPFASATARGVATDGSFVTVVGSFWRGLDVDGDGRNDLHSTGQDNGFVVNLYTVNGVTRWARPIGGMHGAQANAAAIGETLPPGPRFLRGSQLAVTGSFQTDADFNGDGAPELTAPQAGAFLATYDSWDGSFVWAQSDGDDSFFNEGSKVLWDSGRHAFDQLLERGGHTWLKQVDPTGRELWGRALGSSAHGASGLSLDRASNLYVAGAFDGLIDFNHDGLVDESTRGGDDILVVSYTPDGAYRWSRSAGGTYHDWGMAVAVTHWGSVYVGGDFMSATLDFDRDAEPEFFGAGGFDGFLARYDQFFVWLGDLSWNYLPSWFEQPMLPFALIGGFGEFELGDTENLSVAGVFAPRAKGVKDVGSLFAFSPSGCDKSEQGTCARYVFQGGPPLRDLLVWVRAIDPKKPVRFTVGARDLKGIEYRQKPAELLLPTPAKGALASPSLR